MTALFLFVLRKEIKKNPIKTVYRKDDNKSNLFSWLPEDYNFKDFEYDSITDNFENHIFAAEELKEMSFKFIENTERNYENKGEANE